MKNENVAKALEEQFCDLAEAEGISYAEGVGGTNNEKELMATAFADGALWALARKNSSTAEATESGERRLKADFHKAVSKWFASGNRIESGMTTEPLCSDDPPTEPRPYTSIDLTGLYEALRAAGFLKEDS